MAAAQTLVRYGAKVLLLDEQASPGGQIFRRPTAASQSPPALPGYARILQDVYRDPAQCGIRYRSMQCAWGISSTGEIHVAGAMGSRTYATSNLIIATGASEWVLPVAGWTLPGVTTAGGAQALLKTSGVLVGQRIAIGGSGPLLLQVATQLATAGATIVGVFDATSRAEHARAAMQVAAHPPTAMLGVRMLAALYRRGIKVHRGYAITEIRGATKATSIRTEKIGGNSKHSVNLDVDAVCLSSGLIPAIELAALRGCAVTFNPHLGVWGVARDESMATSVEGVFAIGDGAQIGGARNAVLEGEVAGVSVAQRLGCLPRIEAETHRKTLHRRLAALAPIRRYAEATMGPRPHLIAALRSDTIVCRCEDVPLSEVHAAIDDGARSLHELRTRCRVGMGNCQGRTCMSTVARVLSVRASIALGNIPYPRQRPPLRPLSLRELCPTKETAP